MGDPARFFLVMALCFGTVYACLIPPFQSPDEPNHFLRAYQVSEGDWLPEQTDSRLGGVLPVSLQAVADSFAFLKNNYDAHAGPGKIRRAGQIPLAPHNRRFLDFANTAIYAPTGYIPQALAIAVLRPLGAGPLYLLYGCRLLNLWTWCLLIFFAIRMMPGQTWTLATLALLPAALVVAGSCNADVITNGLTWWAIAAACRGCAVGGQFVALLVTAANKLITAPFVLLQLLHRSTGNKTRLQTGGLVVLTLLAAAGWGWVSRQYFISYDSYNPAFRDTQTLNEGVAPEAQLAYIAGHPVRFCQTAAVSFMRAAPSIAAHITGKFGWEKNYIPAQVNGLLWLALLLVVLSERNPFDLRQRLLAACVAGAYIILFAGTMYALWCRVGAPEISNLQGRYFTPVLPLLAIAGGAGLFFPQQKRILTFVMAAMMAGQLAMIWSVWQRYYGL